MSEKWQPEPETQAISYISIDADAEIPGAGIMIFADTKEKAKQLARRICQCVNSRDALLEACEDFVNLAALGMTIILLSDKDNFTNDETAQHAAGMAIVLKGLQRQGKAAIAEAKKK